MLVACNQFSPKLYSVKDNLKHIIQAIHQASKRNAELVVFPECSLTGYMLSDANNFNRFKPEEIDSALLEISKLSCKLGISVIIGSLEYIDGKWVNSCSLIDSSGMSHKQIKNHLPNIGADRFVQAGTVPYRIFNIGDIKVGIIICYDARFPEVTRSLALEGADIIVHPTNLPISSEPILDTILPARAIENRVYIVSSNRTGVENGVEFIGGSRILDVNGQVLSAAGKSEDALIYAELSPAKSRNKTIDFSKVSEKNCGVSDIFLDRRKDIYSLK